MTEPLHRLWTMPVAAPAELRTGGVVLRLPEERDVEPLASYAPDAADHGIWVPTGRLDVHPRTWATWFVQELRLGWTPFGGRYGGGLFGGFVDESFAAYLNFVPHEPGVVELCYGIAPHARGRGLASATAALAAEWALAAGLQEVQLHISEDHAESRRVAHKAGFREERSVTKTVAATGATYTDVIFTRAR